MILSDLNEVLGLMSAPEVRSLAQTYQLFKDKNGGKLSTKKDLVNAIINLSNNQKSVISFFLQAPNSKSSMKNSILKRYDLIPSSSFHHLGLCVISRLPHLMLFKSYYLRCVKYLDTSLMELN